MQETKPFPQTARPPRKRWKKVLFYSMCTLLLLVLVAVGIATSLLRQGLPKLSGELAVSGLTAQVTITRDAEGVPHIEAQNKLDLFFAQGYVHAQDRLFQMDLSRRQASGRLSEVLGEMAVETDKAFRTLGLRRAAEASWPTYSPEGAELLEAYAAGVNAYIAQNEKNLSPEFLLVGYKPEPWTPVDSLTIGKYMAHDLGGHWESQAFRQYLLENFSEDEARELFPDNTYPTGAPLIIPDSASIADRFISVADAKPDEWNGSNNWVLSGSKTDTGKPMLANDPHLSIASPSIWYQMHLKAEDMNVSGVIFAGAPGIIIGHNDSIAWGVTNTGPDVQDLFIERLNPDNPKQYLYKGEWLDAEIVQEPILVKGGHVEPFEVMVTRHGPIISELAKAKEEHTAYALQWTALQPSRELEGMFALDVATDWNSFEKALLKFEAPTQNFVFACQDGTIAYKANGKIPIRANGGTGLLPVPGWDGEHEWIGYIPFDELPRVVNPPAGYVATANHKVIGDDYPYHISHDWASPYRQQRIVQVLESKEKLSADDLRTLQGDVLDLHAEEMLPIFEQALSSAELTDRQQKALESLRGWDRQFTAEQGAPLIFALWYDHIGDVIFEDRISEEASKLFQGRGYTVDGLLRNEASGKPSKWIAAKGGMQAVLTTALDRALDQIESAQGKNMSKWSWGAFHQVSFKHPLSSQAILAQLFNREGGKPSPGTNTTVRAASWNKSGLNNHGASWRYVRDFSQPDYAWQIVAPGQSGHPLSPYYHKQFDRWIEGEQYQTFVTGYSGKTLTLKPTGK